MTKQELFTKAHALTRATIQAGDDYRATFALCLIAVYAEQSQPVDVVSRLVEIGGKRWQQGDLDRVYFNNLSSLIGLTCSHYNTGNISSARLNGEEISNSKARKIQSFLSYAKVWFDVTSGQFQTKGAGEYATSLVAAIQAQI